MCFIVVTSHQTGQLRNSAETFTSPRSSLLATACSTLIAPGARATSLGSSCFAEHLRHEEGELQRLHSIQARIAHRLIAACQVHFGEVLATADTLGDVITGELHMETPGQVSRARWTSKKPCTSSKTLLNDLVL